MKKLAILGVLVGGWYVHSNDLVPDLGLSEKWSRATTVARRAGTPDSRDHELDRIHRMEADLDAQRRFLDQRAARLRELKPGVARRHGAIPAKAVGGGNAGEDDYEREVEALNDGLARFRRLYGTYRDDVDRYNAQARREGVALHRPMAPRTDHGISRRARPLSVGVGG